MLTFRHCSSLPYLTGKDHLCRQDCTICVRDIDEKCEFPSSNKFYPLVLPDSEFSDRAIFVFARTGLDLDQFIIVSARIVPRRVILNKAIFFDYVCFGPLPARGWIDMREHLFLP
ncbi:hypothetical protein AMS69_17845 [Haloarcula rubripromontorii]|uniref:Uncharacterized protein n=1 Tax=Haloarcula rubripromontorii TaxID=1705562 RepID=A0A0M9AIK2_9EURY|nr:hypothetical protein AMS69_17845 [Haloarcula rubripromontorii]